MNDGMLAASVVQALLGSAEPAATAPTAAQAARFHELLQQQGPQLQTLRYDVPAPAAAAGEFRPVLDYMAQVSHDMSSALTKPPAAIDPQMPPEFQANVEFMQQEMQDMRATTMVNLQFELVSKGVTMVTKSAQTLFQQQG